MTKKHIGGDFDDFLRDEHLLDDAEAVAAKRVIAFQISQEMVHCHLTKTDMAHRMGTSRPALDRLLDPTNPSVTLSTLERAASAVGKRLKVELSGSSCQGSRAGCAPNAEWAAAMSFSLVGVQSCRSRVVPQRGEFDDDRRTSARSPQA
jgi:DNA-binding Xre family transcriptional regulator